MTTPNDPTMSHDSLDAVIAAYMLAVEAGDVPNRQELLDRHPEHADALTPSSPISTAWIASPPLCASPTGWRQPARSRRMATPRCRPIRYFGDYELLEEIARGGMGVVYKARQVSLNRLVALKMILAGSFASSRTSSGSAPRPRRPRTWIIRTSCRSTRSASTRASSTTR